MLTCPICLDPIIGDKMTTRCKHSYHTNCILKWQAAHNTCPLCRKNIVPDKRDTRSIQQALQDQWTSFSQMIRCPFLLFMFFLLSILIQYILFFEICAMMSELASLKYVESAAEVQRMKEFVKNLMDYRASSG